MTCRTRPDRAPRPPPTEPRQVILRQPIAQARRHQQDLLTLARQEVLRHQRIVLRPPDDPALCATATSICGALAARVAGRRKHHSAAPRLGCSVAWKAVAVSGASFDCRGLTGPQVPAFPYGGASDWSMPWASTLGAARWAHPNSTRPRAQCRRVARRNFSRLRSPVTAAACVQMAASSAAAQLRRTFAPSATVIDVADSLRLLLAARRHDDAPRKSCCVTTSRYDARPCTASGWPASTTTASSRRRGSALTTCSSGGT